MHINYYCLTLQWVCNSDLQTNRHRKMFHKIILTYCLWTVIMTIAGTLCAQGQHTFSKLEHKPTGGQIMVRAIVEDGDTIPVFKIRDIYVYPPMKFKNKREEKFYWRTVRDVKKVLPLVKYVKATIIETNDTLLTMSSDRERRKYMRGFEKRLYEKEYGRMSKLTLNQGKLLMRLISREMEVNSYDLIKAYRGGFRAGFYQLFARMLGADLKAEFGSTKEDEIIERVINLVQSGQL